MIKTGICPLCGEFITTQFDADNVVIVKHKKFTTLFHKSCYEFNFMSEKELNKESEEN